MPSYRDVFHLKVIIPSESHPMPNRDATILLSFVLLNLFPKYFSLFSLLMAISTADHTTQLYGRVFTCLDLNSKQHV